MCLGHETCWESVTCSRYMRNIKRLVLHALFSWRLVYTVLYCVHIDFDTCMWQFSHDQTNDNSEIDHKNT